MRWGTLAAAVMAVCGCAHGSETLVVTFEGDDAGFATATWAAEQWSQTCGRAVVVQREPGGILMRLVPYTAGATARGRTYLHDRSPYLIEIRRDARDIDVAMLHELGHALRESEDHTAGGVRDPAAGHGAGPVPSDCP